MKQYTYQWEIHTLLTQFICAFDDIVIKRYDKDKNALESIGVRYVLAPKQRIMYDIVNKAQNLTLPVVAINVTSISRDNTRIFNKHDSIYNSGGEKNTDIKTPTPINIEVSMSILARYMQDMDQILSNFVPYSNPYIILAWNEPTNIDTQVNEIRSEVLWGGNISLTEPTDVTYTDKFRIIADTSFTIKGWLFKNVNDISKRIYFIDANLVNTDSRNIPLLEDIDSIYNNLTSYSSTVTISLSAIPRIEDIFYNTGGKLHHIISNFTLNKQLSNTNNFVIHGHNFKETLNILLSSSSNLTNNVVKLSSTYTGAVSGYAVSSNNYTILSDNIISVSLPTLTGSGSFNFIVSNEAGWATSYTTNNFKFINQ